MVVIDSRTGCAGHGFMSVAAANAVERGADLAGAVAAADTIREDLQILVMVDTLEYLRRGGRIGAAAAWIGATLKVKPLSKTSGALEVTASVGSNVPRDEDAAEVFFSTSRCTLMLHCCTSVVSVSRGM